MSDRKCHRDTPQGQRQTHLRGGRAGAPGLCTWSGSFLGRTQRAAFVCSFFVLFFCKSLEERGVAAVRRWGWGDGAERGWRAWREVEEDGLAEKPCFREPCWLRVLEKQSRINPKDCHSFVSELCSLWEENFSTFFHKRKNKV